MTMTQDFRALSREMNGTVPRAGSLLLVVIVVLLAALLVWASRTEIDDVTRAQARIIPSGEVQVVQAVESGRIAEILVQEGLHVTAGATLLRLDPTLLKAQLDEALNQADALRIRIQRLEAELAAPSGPAPAGPVFGAALARSAPQVVTAENALFLGNMARLSDEKALIESQRRILTREGERALAEANLAATGRALIGEEIALIAPLVARRIEPETSLIALRREAAELEGRLALAQADQARIESRKLDLDEQERALQSRFRAESLSELATAVAELAKLEQRLPALMQRAAQTELTAPAEGIVNRILVTTLGGVVSPGQTLVEIVPSGAATLVEAYVTPSDIAFLRPDQPVRIRLTAYDAARYGALEGHITRIGADAVTAPDGESQVFVVEVAYTGSLKDRDDQPLEVIPGMIAEVDILSEKKKVLDYLTRPVVRIKDRAFRD